jgi:Predicted membrane protein
MQLHDKIYKKVIYAVTVTVLYILLLAIIIETFNIFRTIWYVLLKTGDLSQVVYGILTIFVLIDLFKTFADYRVHERIRLTYVTDATILTIMREITVLVYSNNFKTDVLLVFSALLLVLSIMRFISINYHPTDGLKPLSFIKYNDAEEKQGMQS